MARYLSLTIARKQIARRNFFFRVKMQMYGVAGRVLGISESRGEIRKKKLKTVDVWIYRLIFVPFWKMRKRKKEEIAVVPVTIAESTVKFLAKLAAFVRKGKERGKGGKNTPTRLLDCACFVYEPCESSVSPNEKPWPAIPCDSLELLPA